MTIENNNGNYVEIIEDNSITGHIHLEVTRSNGEVEQYDQPMESFTQRFLEVISAGLTQDWPSDDNTTYRTINSSSAIFSTADDWDLRHATSVNKSYGIRVGSGSTAVSLDDYRLEGLIGAGELEMSQQGGTFDFNGRTVTFSRTFENISGGNVTVNEIGMRGTQDRSQSESLMMLLTRDVLNSSIVMADGDFLSVSITLSWSNFQRNFGGLFQMLYADDGDSSVSVSQTDGGSATISQNSSLYFIIELLYPETDESGLVVGTGTNAVSSTDTTLQTRINGGSSSGQLVYGPTRYKKPYNDGSKVYMDFIRSFTNVSGGSITINEIGLYLGNSTAAQYMYYRRVLSSPITINDNESKIIRFSITTAL